MKLTYLRQRTALIVLSFCLCSAASAVAQNVQVETQYQANQRDRRLNAAQPSLSVNDPELGDISLVNRQQRPKMFSFWTTQTFNFTSNAFLARNNTQDDFFWNGRVGVAFIPYATRDFTPRISFEQNFFRYSDLGQLDFDSQTLTFDVKYDLNPNDTTFVNVSYALSRLESPDNTLGEFYKYGLFNVSMTHLMQVQLGGAPITFGITGGAYWRAGQPSSSDRISLYANAVAIYSICEKVQLTGFARPEMQFYTNDPVKTYRKDFNVNVGASISWTPIEYFSVAATASYIGNFSTVSPRRYDVFLPSVVLAAQISF